jgi:hypothetical protein
MCLACEQDAIWLAYLESQGLLAPDDPAAVEKLFAGFPVQPLPAQSEAHVKPEDRSVSATSSAPAQNPFFCDDPKAG